VRTQFLKGTGFSPYVTSADLKALAAEGSVFAERRSLRPKGQFFVCSMYGLKPVPFKLIKMV
jgi:hypothetical protein